MRNFMSTITLLLAFTLPLVASDRSTGTIQGTLKSVWLRKYSMIVYLEKVDGAFKPSASEPVIDQKDKMFVPHLIPAIKGTTVRYVNHDDTKHNVYFVRPDGKKINLGTGMADWSREQVLDLEGVYVQRCNIHDEMSAYVVSFGNPFYALVKKRSNRDPAGFTIEGVPAGSYKLRVWCEKFYRKTKHRFNRTWNVTVSAGAVTKVALKP